MEETYNHTITSLDGGIRLGFNSTRLFYGFNVNFSLNDYGEDRMTRARIENNDMFLEVYFGYRLRPLKLIKKPVDWLNKKLKL